MYSSSDTAMSAPARAPQKVHLSSLIDVSIFCIAVADGVVRDQSTAEMLKRQDREGGRTRHWRSNFKRLQRELLQLEEDEHVLDSVFPQVCWLQCSRPGGCAQQARLRHAARQWQPAYPLHQLAGRMQSLPCHKGHWVLSCREASG